ncbi:hypothetical protein [Pseudomonas sp. lyk4-R2A-10]|uniref:hypothetical protein n=1 Tax=Pseudomonas sp. lyk4-R2A-10 TaxID=3040315 RepID=UPI00255774A2|nr:hypothetical protein [Pseudomonas sp. lyk4-R2A-10]
MTQHSSEELEKNLSDVERLLPELDDIQNLFWKTTAQCQTLLSEGGATSNPVKITGSARRFTASNLFYIDSLDFHGENVEKIASNLTVIVKPVGSVAYTLKLIKTERGSFAYARINKFCEWFEIYTTSNFGKPTLNRISICGSDASQLSQYAKDIDEINNAKKRITSFKTAAKDDYETSLAETEKLRQEFISTKNSIDFYNLQISELKKESAQLANTITKEKDFLAQLKLEEKFALDEKTKATNNVAQLTGTADYLNKQISNLNIELKKLTNDKNLISDEYGPYVKEGNSQAKIYSALITIPLLTILFSIYEVYIGASNLLTTEYKSATDIIAAFILRIPFAAIFGLAIIYSWKLAYFMIQKVFKIHSDRLTLAKLLVVARETVHSSARNLKITDHEKFQEQTALKIEVLKSHMARDLNENFTYKPIPSQKTTAKESAAETSDEAVNDGFLESEAKTP